jgi:hypothetical protein
MSNKWEIIGSGDGLSSFIPGPDHTIVRDTETGIAKEVYGDNVGEAIANGQFTDRDVSQFNK